MVLKPSWGSLGDPRAQVVALHWPEISDVAGRWPQSHNGGFRHVIRVPQKRWMVYGTCHNKNG